MADFITIPDLGSANSPAKVIKVLLKSGQMVSPDDIVLEMESDKATIEIPAGVNGQVKRILVKEGDDLITGAKVAEVTASADSAPSAPNSPKTDAPAPQTAKSATEPSANGSAAKAGGTSGNTQTITLKNLGDGMEKISILKVLIKAGDEIKDASQTIFEAESDKATIEVPAETTGKVTSVFIKEGQQVSIGDKLFEIAVAGGATAAATPPAATETPDKPVVSAITETPSAPVAKPPAPQNEPFEGYTPLTKGKLVAASPKIRRFAREIGVDLSLVIPTGAGGRITEDDVKDTAKTLLSGISKPATGIASGAETVVSEPTLPDFSAFGETVREEMNKIKQITARHMSLCNRVIPMVTHFDEADITVTEESRKQFKNAAEQKSVKLTMTGILVKAAAHALKEFPKFNASIDTVNNCIVLKQYYNIGIAVDTPAGLVVPVIKNADKKSILEISKDLGDISAKAKSRKLTPQDMQGATFTISNLGGIAGKGFTPIVSWPEVAILGVSKGEIKPVYRNGEFVPRLMMPLSLTYDHRIIDGADGARFMKFLCEIIADPFALSFY